MKNMKPLTKAILVVIAVVALVAASAAVASSLMYVPTNRITHPDALPEPVQQPQIIGATLTANDTNIHKGDTIILTFTLNVTQANVKILLYNGANNIVNATTNAQGIAVFERLNLQNPYDYYGKVENIIP
jgi:hypothetical protein